MNFRFSRGFSPYLHGFRSSSCDFSPCSSGFRSCSCEMKTDVQGFFRVKLDEISSVWVILDHIPFRSKIEKRVMIIFQKCWKKDLVTAIFQFVEVFIGSSKFPDSTPSLSIFNKHGYLSQSLETVTRIVRDNNAFWPQNGNNVSTISK